MYQRTRVGRCEPGAERVTLAILSRSLPAVVSRMTPAMRLLTTASSPLDILRSQRLEDSGEILRM
jgi:hypothetical protein